ncbi:MAG: hypothetical protein H0V78_03510 [Burkholderiales bacterium]|nr:hypothetical protein [Burkholderiales bacterium]
MNKVPAFSHNHPSTGNHGTGHDRTSDFETKRDGHAARIAKMSSQETWLATSMTGSIRASGAVRARGGLPAPSTFSSTPRIASSFPDQL